MMSGSRLMRPASFLGEGGREGTQAGHRLSGAAHSEDFTKGAGEVCGLLPK